MESKMAFIVPKCERNGDYMMSAKFRLPQIAMIIVDGTKITLATRISSLSVRMPSKILGRPADGNMSYLEGWPEKTEVWIISRDEYALLKSRETREGGTEVF